MQDNRMANYVQSRGGIMSDYDIEYDIFCNGDWVAGTNDIEEARNYGFQYAEDGDVEVFERKSLSTLILIISKK
jgi:hypothetical protein